MYIVNKFQKLESLAKNFEDFLSFISAYMLQHSSEETVRILKLSGIGVQKYSNSDKLEELKTLIEALYSRYGDNDENIEKWKQELEEINYLYVELVRLREEHGVSKINRNRQAAGFLIALEIYLGSIKEYSNGKKIEDIKKFTRL